ncbi:MAG: thioredoxin-like domain-containing protein [Phycisphaerales bacterium]
MLLSLLLAALIAVVMLAWPTGAFAQVRAPELAPNLGWLNTDRPLRLKDELKGHVVVLDFWTLGCINCIHILPDLEYLEQKYKDEPVAIIGVHSAKFTNESSRQAIRNAMQRYGIHHPVVIDDAMKIWDQYAVRGWPGFVVIDSAGKVIGATGGEGQRAVLDKAVAQALKEGREKGTLAKAPFKPKLDATVPSVGGLAFPGKVIGVQPRDGKPGWVFVSDTAHHRVIAANWPDADGRCEVQAVFGSGEPGLTDGLLRESRFFEPQGLAYDPAREVVYVADRRNHAIREINLATAQVATISGDGTQGTDRRGGKAGREQRLSSPWDVALAPDGKTLYIAMAGPHQLWQLDVPSGVAKVLAGSGREAIGDGEASQATLAQPSGLSLGAGGTALYFADSETSAIRVLDLSDQRVHTLIGTGLFDFGDVDGTYPKARLQHALGVAVWNAAPPGGTKLIIADTYNHKLKLLDPKTQTLTSWMGVGRADAASDQDLKLDEPGGLFLAGEGAAARLFVADTNNHRVVVIDPNTKKWQELMITGLDPKIGPGANAGTVDARRAMASKAEVAAAGGKPLTLEISPTIPAGAHPNAEAPVTIIVRQVVQGKNDLGAPKPEPVIAQRTTRTASFPVTIEIPSTNVKTGAQYLVELSYAYCTEGDNAACISGEGTWLLSITAGEKTIATLK